MAKNIIAFAGSLREKSINKGLLRAVVAAAPAEMSVTIIDFSQLPMFNQDLEAQFPAAATELKQKIRAADGIIIATPEFNRSIPGALKNLLDWTSRPYGDNAWAGKPVAMMGAGGSVGTAVAQSHLKEILLYLDARVLGQPEFYVNGFVPGIFDEAGNLIDEKTKGYVVKLLTVFQKFIG